MTAYDLDRINPLEKECKALRKTNALLLKELASVTAQCHWVQGASFATIDQLVRRYGYKVERFDVSEPRLVPVESVVNAA